jgi:hypothetical protein
MLRLHMARDRRTTRLGLAVALGAGVLLAVILWSRGNAVGIDTAARTPADNIAAPPPSKPVESLLRATVDPDAPAASAPDASAPTPIGFTLTGRVHDEPGRAIAGASVIVDLDADSIETTSGARGDFELRGVPPGTYRLLVVADGYLDRELECTADALAPAIDCVLTAGATVTGTVNARSGAPIAGATIHLCRGYGGAAMARMYCRAQASTGADGRFRLAGVPDAFALMVDADGFVPHCARELHVGDAIAIALDAAGALCGRVLDATTRQPVTEFVVQLHTATAEPGEYLQHAADYPSEWSQQGVTIRDRDGRWSVTRSSLTVGAVTALEIRAAGYRTLTAARVAVTRRDAEPPTYWLTPDR